MAQPIEIVIRKGSGTSVQDSQPTSTPSVASVQKGDSGSLVGDAVNVALVNAGKQIVGSLVNTAFTVSGNSIAQRKFESISTIASYGMQVAIGGPVGLVAVGVQEAIRIGSQVIENNRTNQQSELLYERTGNIAIDGGRGTYE